MSNLDESVLDWDAKLARTLDALQFPCYVYSKGTAIERWQEIVRSFPSFETLVSMKANPNLDLTRQLALAGAAFDLGSEGEIGIASSAGADLRRCSFVGPGKDQSAIRKSVEEGVGIFIAESEEQLRKLASTCDSLRVDRVSQPRVLIRINPDRASSDANELMGGLPSQFGIEESELDRVVGLARNLGVRLSGLHYFLGSQLRTLDAHAENLKAIASSIQRLGTSWHETEDLPVLNVGGGFGIAQQPFEKEVGIGEVASYYQSSIDEIKEMCGLSLEAHLECGRWIFAPAGVFVSRVIDIKRSHGELFVIVESGISGFSRSAFLWGEPHPLWILGKPYLDEGQECTVVGPTCLPGDVIGRKVRLVDVKIGDPIVVGLAGAYGYSMSALHWGNINPTSEILID